MALLVLTALLERIPKYAAHSVQVERVERISHVRIVVGSSPLDRINLQEATCGDAVGTRSHLDRLKQVALPLEGPLMAAEPAVVECSRAVVGVVAEGLAVGVVGEGGALLDAVSVGDGEGVAVDVGQGPHVGR